MKNHYEISRDNIPKPYVYEHDPEMAYPTENGIFVKIEDYFLRRRLARLFNTMVRIRKKGRLASKREWIEYDYAREEFDIISMRLICTYYLDEPNPGIPVSFTRTGNTYRFKEVFIDRTETNESRIQLLETVVKQYQTETGETKYQQTFCSCKTITEDEYKALPVLKKRLREKYTALIDKFNDIDRTKVYRLDVSSFLRSKVKKSTIQLSGI